MNETIILQTGPAATVKPWPFKHAAANLATYLAFLSEWRLFIGAAQRQERVDSTRMQVLMDQVLIDAGLDPDQAVSDDFRSVLDAIEQVNGVDELVSKPIGLLVRKMEAINRQATPVAPSSSTPLPSDVTSQAS